MNIQGAARCLLPIALAVPAMAAQAADGTGAPDPLALADYIACARAAESRVLAAGEAAACAEAFLVFKLSFVPGVTRSDYAGLPAAGKAAVNRAAYAAYTAWRAAVEEGT